MPSAARTSWVPVYKASEAGLTVNGDNRVYFGLGRRYSLDLDNPVLRGRQRVRIIDRRKTRH
jgi:hypothetical protein